MPEDSIQMLPQLHALLAETIAQLVPVPPPARAASQGTN